MAILSRDQILAAKDRPTETVSVPEWGGEVIVTGMTGSQRDSLEASVIDRNGRKVKIDLKDLRAKVVARTMVGEDGKPLFDESDIAELGKKSAAALQRVYEVGQRLSGMSDTDVEELAGN